MHELRHPNKSARAWATTVTAAATATLVAAVTARAAAAAAAAAAATTTRRLSGRMQGASHCSSFVPPERM